MSRPEIAYLLIAVIGMAMVAVAAFLVILARERRRRSHWSTRARDAHPHWSIALANRIERFSRFDLRRRSRRHRRGRNR